MRFSHKILSKPIKNKSPGDLHRAACNMSEHTSKSLCYLNDDISSAKVFYQRTSQGDFHRLPATPELS